MQESPLYTICLTECVFDGRINRALIFQHAKVNQWTNGVVESCLASLTKLQKPFKYIVTCVIMQKNGAGLHTASSCYWDNSTDGEKY